MENKEAAFNILSAMLKNPENKQEFMKVEQDNKLTPEDAVELEQLLPIVQYMKNQQAIQLEAIKEQINMGLVNTKNTFDSLIKLKESLNEAMQQAKKGYAYVMWMYVVVFYLGIGLIVTAVVFGAMGKTILAITFGSIGLIDIITYMLLKPPLELQTSRSNYAQLTAALISWFSDLMNLNSFLATKPLGTPFSEVAAVSDKQYDNTTKLLALIEKYSEPGKTGKLT